MESLKICTFMDYFNQKYVNFDIGKLYREKWLKELHKRNLVNFHTSS